MSKRSEGNLELDPLTSAFEYQREEIHECIGQMWHGEFRALILELFTSISVQCLENLCVEIHTSTGINGRIN